MKSNTKTQMSRIALTAAALTAVFTVPSVHAQAPKPPTVTAPTVKPPTAPTAQAPAPAPAPVPAANTQAPRPTQTAAPGTAAPAAGAPTAPAAGAPTTGGRAGLITTAYDEAAFKAASGAGQPIVILFASSSDPAWGAQVPALQTIFREPEFNQRVLFYQVDMSSTELVTAFGVKSAGTILIMKDGVERMRSTRMVKADPIRKMLRLRTAL